MMPHPMLVEALHKDRVDRLMAEANHLRLIREARAGRQETALTHANSLHIQGGLQAALAAMTRLWRVAFS